MKTNETNTPESLAAIIAEIRHRANNHRQDGWESVGEELDDLADRIERANVRALALLAEELAQLEAEAESEKRWANDYFTLARRREDALTHCKQYAQKIERENEEGETRLDAEEIIATVDNEFAGIRPAPAPGSAAAMRAALNQLRDWALLDINENAIRSDEPSYKKLVDGIVEITNDALAAPARNCDVGTKDEQKERFKAFCEERDCHKCQFYGSPDCPLDWAQMPFAPAKGGGHA